MKLMKRHEWQFSGSRLTIRTKKKRACEWTTLLHFRETTIGRSVIRAISSFLFMAAILRVLGVGRDLVIFAWNEGNLLIHFASTIEKSSSSPRWDVL
jgi:hypothetical protein